MGPDERTGGAIDGDPLGTYEDGVDGLAIEEPGSRRIGDDAMLDPGLAQLPRGQAGAVHEGPALGHEHAQLEPGLMQAAECGQAGPELARDEWPVVAVEQQRQRCLRPAAAGPRSGSRPWPPLRP